MDEDLAAVHAYLCADGYVIKNPETQKLKYYRIGLRNTNLALLTDFQKRFYNYFGVEPHLYPGERCQLGSKEIYQRLTNSFGSFYSWEWTIPKLNNNLVKIWLRTYFDCEGWVFCKSHQNRHLGVDSVNEKGLNQVELSLNKLGIKTIRKFNKKRKIHRIFIYGEDNLIRFAKEIGFLHPNKNEKLKECLNDFVVYDWGLSKNKEKIRAIFLEKVSIKKPYIVRVFSRERTNVILLRRYLAEFFKIRINNIKVNERFNGIGTRYYELGINKKEEVQKLIKHKLISPEQLSKIDKGKLKC